MIRRASLLLLLALTMGALPAAAQQGVTDTEIVIGTHMSASTCSSIACLNIRAST